MYYLSLFYTMLATIGLVLCVAASNLGIHVKPSTTSTERMKMTLTISIAALHLEGRIHIVNKWLYI